MKRRPTRALAAVAGCGALLLLMAGPAQAAWLGVIGALVLGVPLGSLVTRSRLTHATVEVRTPERARVGEQVALRVHVHAIRGAVPLHRLSLLDGPFEPFELLVEAVPRGTCARSFLSAAATRRGVFPAVPIRVRSGAPFGLLRSEGTGSATAMIEIGAALLDLPAPLLRAVTGATDVAAERRRGVGDELHAVRDFRTGDAMRDVHWRSTARAGRLVVKEYERPVPTRSAVAVAGGAAGEPFERLVSAAASIAHAWWRAGEPVDVVQLDGGRMPTVISGASQYGLLSWSAGVQPGDADVRLIARALLDDARPTTVVLAVGPGASGIGDACGLLLAAGCFVTVVALPGLRESLPAQVAYRVLDGDDAAAALGRVS